MLNQTMSICPAKELYYNYHGGVADSKCLILIRLQLKNLKLAPYLTEQDEKLQPFPSCCLIHRDTLEMVLF